MMQTVRDATFDVLRRYAMTTLFANPGSSEVSLLTGLPDDLSFVLALHEGSVVGMATGHAIATDRPALAIVHTTAGLGNAVGALATARVNRAPLVVIVGQQDRRHLALEPFLTGRLDGLAGEYPVWRTQPARAQDVPGAVARAWHEAQTARGPALVVVPMDDWLSVMPPDQVVAAPRTLLRPSATALDAAIELAALLNESATPVIVAGAGADHPRTWAALVTLAERLACPVWQESFGARAGFPQNHPQYAGVLPPGRAQQRTILSGHDFVLAVGAPVFRHNPYQPGHIVTPGTRIAVVTDDPSEAHRAPADLAILASPATVCEHLPTHLHPRPTPPHKTAPGTPHPQPEQAAEEPHDTGFGTPAPGDPRWAASGRPAAGDGGPMLSGGRWATDEPAEGTWEPRWVVPAQQDRADAHGLVDPGVGEPLRAAHVLAALAVRLAPETIVVEETPSSRPELHRLLPARRPLGFVSAAMGGLGFALPAAVGLRMALPDRPVVAVVGDGSAIYGIQALWSAARYRVGALFVVLANGRYAVMDQLAEAADAGKPPWPPFEEVSLSGLATAFGCPARRITGHDELLDVLDGVIPSLLDRTQPLLLDIAIAP
ncbi:thiamine pyrophosphate-dependent enzyme [Nonomuraea endophytica]|uniref:Benzoylformate decarboxylase n=1 Tax=Nonomuraea endophytica TaxID=714136 RepID=A0A7W8EM98_9ACTN|nr:thiamine pyrophosphate-dependent enzyme [Nonomuraea endophytica]MBB5084173.1 benzoylformate decarboxylase [Nonomuraea endophytica]